MNASKKIIIASLTVSAVLVATGMVVAWHADKKAKEKAAREAPRVMPGGRVKAPAARPAPAAPEGYLAEGLWYANNNSGKFALIGADGRPRTKFEYSEIRPFSEKRAVVVKDGKQGFIDESGRVVGKIDYDVAYKFMNSFAIVKRGGKAGFVDLAGREIVAPKEFDSISPFDYTGVARAEIHATGETVVIDKTGKVLNRGKGI